MILSLQVDMHKYTHSNFESAWPCSSGWGGSQCGKYLVVVLVMKIMNLEKMLAGISHTIYQFCIYVLRVISMGFKSIYASMYSNYVSVSL